MHMSTLAGTTQMVTPLAESTPMTQPSQMPMLPDRIPPAGDILEPTSNEHLKADILSRETNETNE